MSSSVKQQRTAERIQEVLSQLLMKEVSDPRLQGITITDVKVDPEIMFARIYVNALGDESRREEVMEGLERANGFLRSQLAQHIRVRTMPELRFLWDEALARANRVESILDSLDIPKSTQEDDEGELDLDLDEVSLDPFAEDDDDDQ